MDLRAAIREHVPDVRGPLQGDVVQAHQDPVPGDLQVLLHGVGPLPEREVVRGEGMLGHIGGRATVADDGLAARSDFRWADMRHGPALVLFSKERHYSCLIFCVPLLTVYASASC